MPATTGTEGASKSTLPSAIREKWRAGVEARIKCDEVDALVASGSLESDWRGAWQDRQCQVIERFCIAANADGYEIKVKFKDQGDTLPPELAKHMENLLSAMTEVEEFEKKGNDMAADSPESLQMLRFDLVEKVEEKLQKCFPEISQHGLQGANLRGSVLPGVNLCGAQLQGASLSETYLLLALMRNANLIGATLAWADMLGSNLQDAKIQGASFEGASLAGAFLMNVRAEKANFSMARMQGAVLGRADLRGANFANADLTNAMLHLANLQGAVLGSSKLRGANLMNADLTDADLCNADLSGAILTGVKWDRAPDCTGMKCDVLEIPRFAKKGQAPNGWLLSSVGSRVLKSFTSGGDDEDSDAEDSEGEEGDEDGARGTEEGDEEGADASGCAAPLLSCGQVQSELVDVSELATEKLADAGRRRVEAALQNLDQRLQPKAQALMKVLENPKMTEMLTEKAMATQGLQESVRKLASLGSSVSGKKFEQAFQKFEGELQKRQLEDGGKALTSWVMSLGDSHFKAHTGYSSSDLLGFLKVSPKQMARDTRELEEIHNYLEKLQENVNKNNWDDIVDNFVCLYNMYQRLKGERSRQVFTQIWQSEELRRAVGVGRAFQEIECRDTPPNFVLRQVKSAVQIVKKLRRLGRGTGQLRKNVVIWRPALATEMAAIELTKTKQANFFAFLISALSGFFMFIATFFSGLALDALRADHMEVPLISFFTHNSSAVHL